MSDDGAPKSAYELAMQRLKQKDRDEGIEERAVSDEQKAEIAELRRVYEAKLAEREILHRSKMMKAAADASVVEALEDEYRRDRERIQVADAHRAQRGLGLQQRVHARAVCSAWRSATVSATLSRRYSGSAKAASMPPSSRHCC